MFHNLKRNSNPKEYGEESNANIFKTFMWEQVENQFLQKEHRKNSEKEENKIKKQDIRRRKITYGKEWQRKQLEQKKSTWVHRPLETTCGTPKNYIKIQTNSAPPENFQSIVKVLQSHKINPIFPTEELCWSNKYLFYVEVKGKKRAKVRFLFHNLEDLAKIENVSMVGDALEQKNNEF